LALLISTEKPKAWASLRGGSGQRMAETVMTIGFLISTISALAGSGNDRGMMQISTPLQPEVRGSPLLDSSGSVVGILASKLNAAQIVKSTDDITQNATFAVSLGTIQSFLDGHAIPYVLNNNTESKNYADIAAEAMRYTLLLECAR
jgi:hypothetical protein